MGFACGFDIYPRLEATTVNKQAYQRFLDEVISTYDHIHDENGRREDGKILVVPATSDNLDKMYIRFMVGECPEMPSNAERCDYFLRFSSKVSGRLTTPAEPYIHGVHQIAQKHFGSRVHFWHELCEAGDERQWGCYDWLAVHEADEELRELEAGHALGRQHHTLQEQGQTNGAPNGPAAIEPDSEAA